MNLTVQPLALGGSIPAIPSKSDVHRKLICAALAQGTTRLRMTGGSEDIDATVNCLTALGARVQAEEEYLKVSPIAARGGIPRLDCGESGSTLRFMLPVALAVTDEAAFEGRGRLPERPIGVLMDALKEKGGVFSSDRLPFTARGKMAAGVYAVPGDVSSQFITGLLLALPCVGGGEVHLTTPLRSAEYVDITIAAMARFGVTVERIPEGFRVPAGAEYISPGEVSVEGDWSNAAFFLTAGAIGGDVTVTGIDSAAAQGDRRIVPLLRSFGACVEQTETAVRVRGGVLCGCSVDIDPVPDLLPILSVAAACAEGETLFYNAARLRLKESDRLVSTAAMLRALGGRAEVGPDWLRVYGTPLTGGTVDACHDHRIAMSAAIAAGVCSGPVHICDALCVGKSYPKFYEDLCLLGGAVR